MVLAPSNIAEKGIYFQNVFHAKQKPRASRHSRSEYVNSILQQETTFTEQLSPDSYCYVAPK